MIIASALAELGEDRSWASIWWPYGALRYDMSDEALDKAFDLWAVSFTREKRRPRPSCFGRRSSTRKPPMRTRIRRLSRTGFDGGTTPCPPNWGGTTASLSHR